MNNKNLKENMQNQDETIRKKINKLITEKDMSKRQFAIKAGISYNNLHRFLQGGRKGLSKDTLYKIARTYSVSLDYFLNKDDESKIRENDNNVPKQNLSGS